MIYLVHLTNLQDPIAQKDLVDDGLALKFMMTEDRGLAGGPAIVELEIENPGLSILSRTGNVAVVDTPTGSLADGRILCRARIVEIPDDLGSLTIPLKLECAPAGWRGLLRQAANNSVAGAGIPPYAIPVIPQPGAGTIALAFARSVGTAWDTVKGSAVRVQGLFQDDLLRSPLSSFLNFQTLSIANARLTLTIADSPAARTAARVTPFVLVGVSGDKDPTHAVKYAAGSVMQVRPAPGGLLDVIVNLGTLSLAQAGIAPLVGGDLTRQGLPYYEPLFPGARDDLSAAVLEGRNAFWHIDPVTHAITLQDTIKGGRIVDLADLGDAASERRLTVERPVTRVTMKLVCEFQQTAIARVDVAPIVSLSAAGASGEIRSLSYGIPPASKTGGDLDFGWSSQSPKVTIKQSLGVQRSSGRTFAIQYREDVMSWSYYTDPKDGIERANAVWAEGSPYTIEHAEFYQPVVNSITYLNWIKSCSFTQTRREVVDLVLDVDTQTFATAEDTLDLGPIQLSDVNGLDGVQPYVEGVAYNRGDRVLFRGKAYQCLADRVVAFLVPVTRTRNGVPTTTFETPYWANLGAATPMGNPASPAYFDGTRGRGTIAAVLNRMRAAALKRMQALRVTKTYRWDDARDLRLTDEVSLFIRDGRRAVPVLGHVTQIVRRVEGVASVDVTVALCVGTGSAFKATDTGGAYAAAGYSATTYTPPNTGQYVADPTGAAIFGTAGESDIEYALTASQLFEPVKAAQLTNPSYSVLSVQILHQADEQIGAAGDMIAQGKSPELVTQAYPTTCDVAMRPIRSEGNLERQYSVHGRLLYSPQGILIDSGGAQ